MIARYNISLEYPTPLGGHAENKRQVLITGTTGILGLQILETLLRDSSVRNIYVLNRASGDPRKKHTDCFADKSFNPALLSSEKLVPFLEGDATQKGPRLSKEIYDSLTSNPRDLSWTGRLQLVSNIAIIFHNAWRLDFILSLASFESNIRGTRNIVGPARASAHMVPP